MLNFLKKYGLVVAILFAILVVVGKYFYAIPNAANGDIAPNFAGIQPDSTPFELNSLRKHYVLLDFWGSWCGPCVEEMPEVRVLFTQFHGQKFRDAADFDVVSFGIERDRSRWLSAIERLQLGAWFHVSDFQYLSSPTAKAYGVRVVPTKFLLNTEGGIVAVNPTIAEVRKFLTEKLTPINPK